MRGVSAGSSGGGSTCAAVSGSVRKSTNSISLLTNRGWVMTCSMRAISSGVLTRPMRYLLRVVMCRPRVTEQLVGIECGAVEERHPVRCCVGAAQLRGGLGHLERGLGRERLGGAGVAGEAVVVGGEAASVARRIRRAHERPRRVEQPVHAVEVR